MKVLYEPRVSEYYSSANEQDLGSYNKIQTSDLVETELASIKETLIFQDKFCVCVCVCVTLTVLELTPVDQDVTRGVEDIGRAQIMGIQLSRPCGGSQRREQQSQSLHGSTLCPLHMFYGCWLVVLGYS